MKNNPLIKVNLYLILSFLILCSFTVFISFFVQKVHNNALFGPSGPHILRFIADPPFNFLFALALFFDPKNPNIKIRYIFLAFGICFLITYYDFFTVIHPYIIKYLIKPIIPNLPNRVMLHDEYTRMSLLFIIFVRTGYWAYVKYKNNHFCKMLFLAQCIILFTALNFHLILVQDDMFIKRQFDIQYFENMSNLDLRTQYQICDKKRYICVFNWDNKTYTHYHYEHFPEVQELIARPKTGIFFDQYRNANVSFFKNNVLYIDIRNTKERDAYFDTGLFEVFSDIALPTFYFWDIGICLLIYFHFYKRKYKVEKLSITSQVILEK